MKTISQLLKYIILIVFVTLTTSLTFGQTNLQKAQQMMSAYEYQKAIDLFTTHFQTNPPSIDDARLLVECYKEVNDTKLATEWMGKVVAFDSSKPADVKIFAFLLKSEGRYQDAITQFQTYKSLVPAEIDKAEAWIAACQDAQKWIDNPEYWDVSNADMFNTPYTEFGLIPFQKGYSLTSDRKIEGVTYKTEDLYGWTGNPYLKMFYVTMDDKGQSVTKLEDMGNLNYTYHNGPGTFHAGSQTMYYTRTKMVKVNKKPINPDPTSWFDHSTALDYTNRLEIYSAKYNNNEFTGSKVFEYNKAEEYSVGHPAISPDGNTLYFVSDMPGGTGKSDIYYCEKTAPDTWGPPKNAGTTVNSEGNEVFPYMDANGTLYYSSDGLPGMGGLDLFSVKGSKNTWATPENLKYPMSSPKDDFSIYYTEAGKTGYLTSNRDGGKGLDDIYRFEDVTPTELILAVVTKEKTTDNKINILPDVEIAINNKAKNNIQKMQTDANGKLYTKVDCGASFEITGNKEGYFAQVKNIETKCITRNDTVFVELVLDQIVLDKPIVLKNIYYDFDKWDIRPDAALELNKLVVILLQNPNIEIELGSHTDSRGSDQYNMTLSQKRAESAVQYIITNGIASSRIKAKGYGESVPVNRCTNGAKCTDEEFQMNRRTEFKVTKINKGKVTEIKSMP